MVFWWGLGEDLDVGGKGYDGGVGIGEFFRGFGNIGWKVEWVEGIEFLLIVWEVIVVLFNYICLFCFGGVLKWCV